MEKLATATPEVLLTGSAPMAVPPWLEQYSPTWVESRRLDKIYRLPPITVAMTRIQQDRQRTFSYNGTLLEALAERLPGSDHAHILFVLDGSPAFLAATGMGEIMTAVMNEYFRGRTERIDFCLPSSADFQFQAVLAKLNSTWFVKPALSPRARQIDAESDPLGKVREIVAATSDLRSSSGRLAADKIGDRFGLSQAQIASFLGKSRQSVSKTPDAPALQDGLAPFERIARLGAVLPPEDFRKWLNMENEHLDDLRPLDVIRDHGPQVVADLVHDMLTGSTG